MSAAPWRASARRSCTSVILPFVVPAVSSSPMNPRVDIGWTSELRLAGLHAWVHSGRSVSARYSLDVRRGCGRAPRLTGWHLPAGRVRAHRDSRSGVAFWGLPEGPFLYLPVFGPSDPRDAIGLAGNAVMDPFTWVGQGTTVRALDWSRMGVNAIDQRERLLMTSTVQRKRRWTPTRRSAACTGSIGTGRSTIFAKTRAPQFRYGSRNRAHPIKSPIHRPYRRPIDRGHSTPCLTAATSWF